jgi:hypothetical protein
MPLISTALRVSINTLVLLRPHYVTLSRPAVVKAKDGTPLNLLTSVATTCSKKTPRGKTTPKVPPILETEI